LLRCQLCGREGDGKYFEKHHLELQNKKSETITVCHQCGDQLHLMFSNYELKTKLFSLSALLNEEKVLYYIRWVRNKPLNRHFSAAKKKRRT